MKHRNTICAFVGICVLVGLPVCRAQRQRGQDSSSGAQKPWAEEVNGRTAPEAVAAAVWKRLLRQCVVPGTSEKDVFSLDIGDDEVSRPILYQLRGVTFSDPKPEEISQATRLNGVTYRGRAYVLAAVYRKIGPGGILGPARTWTSWHDEGIYVLWMENRNNQWIVKIIPPEFASDDLYKRLKYAIEYAQYFNPDQFAAAQLSCDTVTGPDPYPAVAKFDHRRR
jgi:hypothetical protein